MTYFSTTWKPALSERKLLMTQPALLDEETVWYLGACNNLRPLTGEIALTSLRFVALCDGKIRFQARYADITGLWTDVLKETVTVVRNDGETFVFKMVPRSDHGAILHYAEHGRITPPPAHLADRAALEAADHATAIARLSDEQLAAQTRADEAKSAKLTRRSEDRLEDWPDTIIQGKVTVAAARAIRRQCHGDERPWLILTSFGEGVLVAFDSRAAIIKTGLVTSLVAGSFGGERSATFHFTDITGIEYNSGFSSGVLEILTASYSGTNNHDYWRGSMASRNADAHSPHTLSNALPLLKSVYMEYLDNINELKARIARSKQPTVDVRVELPSITPSPDLVGGLANLVALHDSGVLTDAEFTQAKARLLHG